MQRTWTRLLRSARNDRRSLTLQVLREVLLCADAPPDNSCQIGLLREYLHRCAVSLETFGMEIGAHQRLSLLELGVEPRRRIRKRSLRFAEHIRAARECFGQRTRDPLVCFPCLAAEHNQMLRWIRSCRLKVLPLNAADIQIGR